MFGDILPVALGLPDWLSSSAFGGVMLPATVRVQSNPSFMLIRCLKKTLNIRDVNEPETIRRKIAGANL